jgi:glyoxylase-like metal-dependent hydrolase (beta-lactamase superfamily II)
MVMRVLVEGRGRTIIVDVGSGTGYDAKCGRSTSSSGAITCVTRCARPASIRCHHHVMLTHLHFDHGAGAAEPHGDGWRLVFPKARHHVQKSQWEHALHPNARDKASYFEDRIRILESERVLELHDGPWSLGPGFDMHIFNGHTPGQQLPLLSGPEGKLFFCGDLFPFHHHVPPAWVMSYDLYPVTAMEEKSAILGPRRRAGPFL